MKDDDQPRSGSEPARMPWACPEQEGMCFIQNLHPQSYYLNQPAILRLQGDLDLNALHHAWADVVHRHEALRTCFPPEGQHLRMHIAPNLQIPLPVVNLQSEGEAGLAAHVSALVAQPFDTTQAPLARVCLVRLSPRAHALIYIAHHAITDRWSLGVIVRDLMALYGAHRGVGQAPSPLTSTYLAYAEQRRTEIDAALQAALEAWKARPPSPLPTDDFLARPRSHAADSYSSERVQVLLPSETKAALNKFGRTHRVTLSMILLGAWASVLQRYTRREAVCVGLPVANRNRLELESIAGLFMGMVPTRVDFGGQPTVAELMKRTKRAALEAHRHGQVPYPRLFERLRAEGLLDDGPLFDTLFNAINVPLAVHGCAGLEAALERAAPLEIEFPLVLESEIVGEQIALRLDYQTSSFTRGVARNLFSNYVQLLDGFLAAPQIPVSQVEVLAPTERRKLASGLHATTGAYPRTETLHGLFQAQATEHPDAVALRCGTKSLSYRTVDETSNALAHRLLALGVKAGDAVGLCMPRSVDFVLGALGILKAGAAYLPLDPSDPTPRLEFLLSDAEPSLILFSGTTGNLPEPTTAGRHLDITNWTKSDARPPAIRTSATDRANIIYTSGSTGTPKGVLVPHRGVVRLVYGLPDIPLRRGLTTLMLAPATFDASTFEMWAALLHGGTCVVYPDARVELEALERVLVQDKVQVLWLTSTLFNTIVDARPEALRSVEFLLTGGEALSISHVRRALRALPKTRLFNGYGPTESTTFATVQALSPDGLKGASTVPIGRPIDNTQVFIFDEHRSLLPAGVAGELYIGGDGLAQGYLGDEVKTEASFVSHPFSPILGQKLYRSGDRARWSDTGQLEFLGRIDGQIKIRGYRVEPGEVEALLCGHPAVKQCAVIAWGEGAQRELVAYVTGPEASEFETNELKDYAAQQLPAYMVPGRCIVLDKLPRTKNGKLDRSRLAAPDSERPRGAAPSTDTELSLAKLWRDLLGLRSPTAEDDFFACGGNSLSALALVALISDTWQRSLAVRDIFDNPELSAMAARIDHIVASQRREALPPLVPGAGAKTEQLSYSQERILFLERMDPGSPLYTIPRALRVRGPLDRDRLQAALSRIVERHEVLRTTFVDTPTGKQQFVGAPRPVTLDDRDLSDLCPEAQRERLELLTSSEACRPFDLSADLMLRAQCLRLSSDEYILQVVFHHGFADGWSLGVFWRELRVLYSDPTAPLLDLPVQYRDYSTWQREWLAGARVSDQLAVWKQRLNPLPTPLSLPTDRPRGPEIDTLGSRRYALIPAALVERMKGLAQAEHSTLFMVLLAGFWSLLHRLCGQDDVVVGSPVAGRARKELEGLIGFFVNNVALRGDLGGGPSFRALLAQARDRTVEAYDNQDVPFEKLVEYLQPERSVATSPIYQVMLALLDTPDSGPELSGLSLSPHPVRKDSSVLDLTLFLEPSAEGLGIEAEYRSHLFDGATIDRLLTQYVCVLQGAVAHPSASILSLPAMTDADKSELVRWSRGPVTTPGTSILGMIAEQCAQNPSAEALNDHNGRVSRQELGTRVEALAAHLRQLDVGPDDVVGLYLDRGIPAIVAMLATWRVGGIYLALGPDLPPQRLALLLSDAQPIVIIHGPRPLPESSGMQRQLELDSAGCTVDARPVPTLHPAKSGPGPQETASIIYTSGSSGRPKGVRTRHSALLNRVQWSQDNYPLVPGERWLHKTSLAFVDSAFEIFGALALGVPLQIVSTEVAGDPRRLLDVLKGSGATRVIAVPSLLSALLGEVEATGAPPKSLWLWTSSGEPLPPPLVRRFAELLPGRTLLNVYGSTETGADATAYLVDLDRTDVPTIPIGRPLANVISEVRDVAGELSPVGAFGELFIGGPSVADGYHNRPDLNSSAFADGWFRTGDRARWRADGQLEYGGRADRQVKLRGVRIELEGIEAAMLGCPGVVEAAVELVGEGLRRRIVAYVCPPEAASGLSAQLAAQLPALQCPQQFVGLECLPRTPTGKLDRGALPEAVVPQPPTIAPAMGTAEARLLALWTEELGVPVGPHDDFFAAGGHSLLAVRLFRRIQEEFGVDLALPLIFRAPTVATLVTHIEGALVDQPWSVVQPIKPSGDNAPLFLVHPAPGTIYCYGELAQYLGPRQPVFGIQALGLDGTPPLETVAGMARHYLRALKVANYGSPLRLGGWSAGGVIAFEMARQLAALGQAVEMVVLIDAYCPAASRSRSVTRRLKRRLVGLHRGEYYLNAWVHKISEDLRPVALANLRALRNYVAEPYSGRVVLLQAEPDSDRGQAQLADWRTVAPQIECRVISGSHTTILKPESVADTAAVMRKLLD